MFQGQGLVPDFPQIVVSLGGLWVWLSGVSGPLTLLGSMSRDLCLRIAASHVRSPWLWLGCALLSPFLCF